MGRRKGSEGSVRLTPGGSGKWQARLPSRVDPHRRPLPQTYATESAAWSALRVAVVDMDRNAGLRPMGRPNGRVRRVRDVLSDYIEARKSSALAPIAIRTVRDYRSVLANHAVPMPVPAAVPVGATEATRVMPAAPESPEPSAVTSTLPQRAVEKSEKRRGWLWGLVAFLLVIGAGVGAYYLFNPEARVEQVTVPNVRDNSRDLAEQRLREAKLEVKVDEVSGADDASVDRVINQDPLGGVKVPVNTVVTIQVNIGPAKGTIPGDLVGMTLADAKKALKDLGFTNVVDREDPGATSGTPNTITSTNPARGVTVPLDTRVELWFVPGTATVPNFYGMTRAAAQAQADRLGFTNIRFAESETGEQPAGRVFQQSPGEGEVVKRSQRITLTLAKAPSDPSPSPTPTESEDGEEEEDR